MENLSEEERQKVLKKSVIIKIYTLGQVLKCIELAAGRGAYKPDEMSFVGSVYDILSKGVSQSFEAEIKIKEEANKKLKPISETEETTTSPNEKV